MGLAAGDSEDKRPRVPSVEYSVGPSDRAPGNLDEGRLVSCNILY